MDEDAIPPNRFCSAPPHSEPPPPLLPLSSITPSYVNDGILGHRRSGRIQGIKAQPPKKQSNADGAAAQKPSRQSPSPSKRQGESGSMVQVSQCKQPRVHSTHGRERQNEDGFDIGFAAEHQNKQQDQRSPQKKTEHVAELFSDDPSQNPDEAPSDMDTCEGLAVGHTLKNAAAPKGWVIGPLFQSFKSKMASFTEIVMSPVKLFKANSPPPSTDHPDNLGECDLQPDGAADVELSEPSDAPHPEAQSEDANQEANQQRLSEEEGAQNTKTVAVKYSKKLLFDLESSTCGSELTDECAATQEDENKPDPVPLQLSPLRCAASEVVAEPVQSSIPTAGVSASRESELELFRSDMEKKVTVRLKPLQRKCTGSRRKVTTNTLVSEVIKEAPESEVTDEQVSHTNSLRTNKTETLLLTSSVSCTPADIDCPQTDGDDMRTESCFLVHQSLQNNVTEGANGRTLKQSLDTEQLECELNPKTHSAAGLGRTKRELKPYSYSQDSVKRKRLTVDVCIMDIRKGESVTVSPDSSVLRALRPIRKEAPSTNTSVGDNEMLKPPRKRLNVSTRANKKGKGGAETLVTKNEAVLNIQTESSSDATSVCSLDESSSVSESNQKRGSSSSSKVKSSGSCKRLKTKPDLQPDANSMDLETTIAITSTKQAEPEPLVNVLVLPDVKQLQGTRKCRNTNAKPLKRKSPNHASSTTESESSVASTSPASPTEPLEGTATDCNTPQHVEKEESGMMVLNQPSKRPKKGVRGAVKSSASGETKQCVHNAQLLTKESQEDKGKVSTDPVGKVSTDPVGKVSTDPVGKVSTDPVGKVSTDPVGKVSTDPVYFEMTPFESNSQPGPPPPQPHSDSYAQSDSGAEHFVDDRDEGTASEVSHRSSIDVSSLRSSARRVNAKARRADNQRRKCRVLHSRTRKGDEMSNSVTMEDANLSTVGARSSENGLSRQLLRSYSCPEIPSLRPLDVPWMAPLHSPQQSRTHTLHQHQPSHTPFVHHVHKSLRRARRHTVCSMEVEREIAPLCLRKEVYPSRRSVPYDSATQNLPPSLALSPSTSFTALASCFLSSPLAFLSKKVDLRGAAASSSTSSHVPSPTAASSMHPLSPSTWRLSGFLQRTDSSSANMDSCNSGIPLVCEIDRRQQSEEDDDGEDTSSSSQEFEDAALREEKSLSDSEIKVVQKREERGKVSSIRIRKTLPKPQNNLTPMGLPRPVRLKKKEFSLEEIYTNKNFSKPPESRLETIFEVPLNRRNGSESWFGQRRLKRFLEFLEVGEVRKPKKPLVGVGKASIQSSRTRRGGFPKDEPPLSVQDVDSLLCAKLDQLNLWLMDDQKDS